MITRFWRLCATSDVAGSDLVKDWFGANYVSGGKIKLKSSPPPTSTTLPGVIVSPRII